MKTAEDIAFNANLKPVVFNTSQFSLMGFIRITNKEAPVNVYIEGDGLAFVKGGVSLDPTPINPIGLQLASIDDSDNVLYLARPCQYKMLNIDKKCSDFYWSNGRFAPEIITSFKEVINHYAKEFNKINLVGYSGGAAIAVLVAEQVPDKISSIRTVAGNLNHKAINEYHNVEPQTGSLNPIDYVAKISSIPQIHYIGSKDKIIPVFITKNFVDSIPEPNCAKNVVIENVSHSKGILGFWKDNYKQIIKKCF